MKKTSNKLELKQILYLVVFATLVFFSFGVVGNGCGGESHYLTKNSEKIPVSMSFKFDAEAGGSGTYTVDLIASPDAGGDDITQACSIDASTSSCTFEGLSIGIYQITGNVSNSDGELIGYVVAVSWTISSTTTSETLAINFSTTSGAIFVEPDIDASIMYEYYYGPTPVYTQDKISKYFDAVTSVSTITLENPITFTDDDSYFYCDDSSLVSLEVMVWDESETDSYDAISDVLYYSSDGYTATDCSVGNCCNFMVTLDVDSIYTDEGFTPQIFVATLTATDTDSNVTEISIRVDLSDIVEPSHPEAEFDVVYNVDPGDDAMTARTGYWLDSAINPINGDIHLSYYDISYTGLAYALCEGGNLENCTITEIDRVNLSGRYSGIALDSNYYPHMIHCETITGDLKYVTNASGGWAYTTIASGVNSRFSSIAVDKLDHVHVSFYDNVAGYLYYSYYDGVSWTTVPVETSVNVGQYSKIAVDSANNPYIAAFNSSTGDLELFYLSGSSWTREPVDTPGWTGLYLDIGIDSNDVIHLSYYSSGYSGSLKYAFGNPGTWSIAYIDSTAKAGQWTSLFVDDYDNIHIAYKHSLGTDISIKYMRKVNNIWSDIFTVDTSSSISDMLFPSVIVGEDNVYVPFYKAYTSTNAHLVMPTSAF
ncbi:MAG: hypothetical protein ABIA04_15975 [Pseudomonadota bacterium]